MKQVKIVPMAAEHLDRLEQLERMCFSRPWSKKMLAEELDNQCAAFLVAVEPETEQPVGYAGLLVVADEGYITNVAVDPACRRQGVANQLLQVFDSFAIFTLDGGKRGKTARGRNLCIDFASVHSGETEIEWL